MVELLSRTATILLTEVEGSTALWAQAPKVMQAAPARHDEKLFETTLTHYHRVHIRSHSEENRRFAVFASAPHAAIAAPAIQRTLI
jgi:hypothetical protein